MFSFNEAKEVLRSRLNMDKNKKIVMYSGHLYRHKGIYTLLDAAKLLPSDFMICVLGGTPVDISAVKAYINANKINNVTVLGYASYYKVSQYIASADILVLPNSSKNKFSRVYTSPLKLFEYMASGNIIVSSDVPSLREILNEGNSILVAPDDPKALAEGIRKAANKKLSKLASQAKKEAAVYSWDERAGKILGFIGNSPLI